MLKPLIVLGVSSAFAVAQATSAPSRNGILPATTSVWVKADHRLRSRMGEVVTARTVYPVYGENLLLIPPGTRIRGSITGFHPDPERRSAARLRGDFTPFSKPVVSFRELETADGFWVALSASPAEDGAPLTELTPPAKPKGGLIRRQWNQGIEMAKERLRLITAPGKKDRLTDLFYSQLPYHPQDIQTGTAWNVQTDQALTLPVPSNPGSAQATLPSSNTVPREKSWQLKAALTETLSSRTARVGDPVRALVVEPIRGLDGEVEVPQGAVLEGRVTEARPARRFGRGGRLRFSFLELSFPGNAAPQPVQSTLTELGANTGAGLNLDREGRIEPKPKDKVVVPLVLLALASRPLDQDRGGNQFGKDAVASNALGLAGFVVGTAGGWPNVAAGIGYYGTALSVWNRWVKRGDETVFRKNTRLVLETTARRSAPLPTSGSQPK